MGSTPNPVIDTDDLILTQTAGRHKQTECARSMHLGWRHGLIAYLSETLGWRVYGTNAPSEQLTLEQAVLAYRDEWLIERGFHRLKGASLSLDPLFVQRVTPLTALQIRILELLGLPPTVYTNLTKL